MSILKQPSDFSSSDLEEPLKRWDTYSKISKRVVCIHQYLKENKKS